MAKQNRKLTAEDIVTSGRNVAEAYSTGASWLEKLLFKRGLQQAAKLGLTGTAATQYANQAASNAWTQAGETVGEWLPYVGFGYSAYKLAKDFSPKAAWNTAALGLASFANPVFAAPAAIGGIVSYLRGQKAKHAKHYAYWHTPKFEIIGQDKDGWTYLYDTNFQFHEGAGRAFREKKGPSHDTDQTGFILRYNPQTNELQKMDMGIYGRKLGKGHHYYTMTPEEAKAWISGEKPILKRTYQYKIKANAKYDPEKRCISRGGRIDKSGSSVYCRDVPLTITPEDKGYPSYSENKWKTIDLGHNLQNNEKRDPVYMDPAAFQAEIYNKVLVPQGYVDKPSVEKGWSPATIGGQEYLISKDGYVADPATGQLRGTVEEGTGQVVDLYGVKGRSRLHKDENYIRESEIHPSYLGAIDNWDQVKQKLPQLSGTLGAKQEQADSTVKPTQTSQVESYLPSKEAFLRAGQEQASGAIKPTGASILSSLVSQQPLPQQPLPGEQPSSSPVSILEDMIQSNVSPVNGGSNILTAAMQQSPSISSDKLAIDYNKNVPEGNMLSLLSRGGENKMGSSLLSGSTTEVKEQSPAKKQQYQKMLMDELARALFPAPGQAGLREWMKENWKSRAETNKEYIESLKDLSGSLAKVYASALKDYSQVQRPLAQAKPITVSFGDFSFPMTTGTQRHALEGLYGKQQQTGRDVYGMLDALAKAKALYGEQYGVPYGPEIEYLNQVVKPLATWGEELSYKLPQVSQSAAYNPSFLQKVAGITDTTTGILRTLDALKGYKPVEDLAGGAVTLGKNILGWLGGLGR